MLIKIEVTKEDIEKGTREKCSTCPVALAVNRHLAKQFFVKAFRFSVDVWQNEPRTLKYYCNPGHAIDEFIRYFDMGLPVQPFSFDLDIPSEFLITTN